MLWALVQESLKQMNYEHPEQGILVPLIPRSSLYVAPNQTGGRSQAVTEGSSCCGSVSQPLAQTIIQASLIAGHHSLRTARETCKLGICWNNHSHSGTFMLEP